MDSRNFKIALGVVMLVLVGGAYYVADRQGNDDPQKVAQEEVRKWVAAVGKLMVLPDEQPIIATVVDPSKLGGQAFFANAKKGDKVLIYNTARKAVLYNPSEDLIVEVAPLNIGPSQK